MVATPSRLRALEAIEGLADASVLDVGCGGGRAAFGLTPPATSVVGVDHQQAMLDVFTAAAEERHVTSRTVLGDWPDVADEAPSCDVVVCHHVLYNVQRIAPFLQALDAHAHRRVVIEMPVRHPLSHMADLWKHFWDLDRPQRPGHGRVVPRGRPQAPVLELAARLVPRLPRPRPRGSSATDATGEIRA